MAEQIHYIDFETLENFMRDVFIAEGVPAEDAKFCANVLITADKLGIDSHGIGRLKPIYIDRIRDGIQKAVTDVEFVRKGPATAVIDAHDGMGMVAAKAAMEYAMDAAEKFGIGMTVVRNSTHYGIAGYYPLMAVKRNMIGICGTNARPSIAPTFGVENMLGTNPLTFALPTDEDFPFCIDCATSIVQRGKIEYDAREGIDVPAGMVVARDGSTPTDAAAILDMLVEGTAALAPLGGGPGDEMCGYKGYGYATVVEILSAALAGGQFMKALNGIDAEGKPEMYHLGHFFFVVDPEAFAGGDTFRKVAGDICRALRASAKAPGYDRIYTAGEKEWLVWQERKDKGVPVGAAVQEEILAVRDKLGLPYTFPFE
jgi:LDH2 family malate/lactate/ureidoglycolate dehydrogenase